MPRWDSGPDLSRSELRNYHHRIPVTVCWQSVPIAGGGYSGPLSASQIVLAAALENFARRHKVWNWRTGRPRLSRLLDEIAARPTFTATVQPELNV